MRKSILGLMKYLAILIATLPSAAWGQQRVGEFGYMVVGPSAVRDLGLPRLDTIPEIPRPQVAVAVVRTADSLAAQLGRAPGCTRFFVASKYFLVLLTVACDPARFQTDGESMVAIGFDGKQHGRTVGWLQGHYSDVCPSIRPDQMVGTGSP